MAYHNPSASATFMPGINDDFYMPTPPAPELVSPEPQRINPDMSSQIADGIEAVQRLTLTGQASRGSSEQTPNSNNYSSQSQPEDAPHFSPFPKLVNPPANVPPSDDELEATLENARAVVLNSNDPEMQLAWAADALVYVGVCADNEERLAAARPYAARSVTPRIEHQLKTDAMNVVNFLADQKHPKAEFLKGMWLEWGRFGQREDKKEAFRCYSRAADRGYARAEYRIGMLYESYNDPIKALKHYNRGVDAGDAASCYRLGMMTLRGQCGQAQDYNKAIDLIRRSAEAADENAAQGAYVYGMLLCRGLPQITLPDGSLPYDERQARTNIEKAAYLKFAKAQLKMGSVYELAALGCEFNPALSIHYNALAAKQGEPEADMALSKWFLVGSEGLFPKNEELAFTYAERAAQSGLATGEFALGYFHEIGMYVPVNLPKAMEWYEKASSHGNEDAKGRIAGLQNKQVLSRKDHENVAISKIKSQYGSMRGARPDRFRQPQQISSLQGSTISEHGNVGSVPPRGTTPYPESDLPPLVAQPLQRPATVVPYPTGDGPPRTQQFIADPGRRVVSAQQPPPRPSTTLNPEVRPSSAFQINPELRHDSTMNAPGGSYANRPSYPGGPTMAGRPNPAQPYGGQPYQGQPPASRPYQGGRVASGPPGSGNFPPYQGAPQASQRPPMGPPQGNASVSYPPRMDSGYSQPMDDRRSRMNGPNQQTPQSYAPRADSKTRTNQMPNPSGRMSTPNSMATPGSRPSDSRRPMDPRNPLPPPKIKAPASSGTPKPTTPAPSTQSKPPKGPKTFDEMGVPSQKQDGECIVM